MGKLFKSSPFQRFPSSAIFSTKILGIAVFTIFFVLVMVNQIEMVINSHQFIPLPSNQWSHIRIVPLPMNVTNGTDVYFLHDTFTFETTSSSKILKSAIQRYHSLIFTQQTSNGIDSSFDPLNDKIAGFNLTDNTNINPNFINKLVINIISKDETLQLGMDESYSLLLETKGFELNAKTVFGALRGLESFSQMIEYSRFNTASSYFIQHCPWRIFDKPRFQHRGTLLDTSKQYIPIQAIQSFIDALSYSKFNVFHWHLIVGSQKTQSNNQTYSHSEIKTIVEYAKERGIRVLVEVDMPAAGQKCNIAFDSSTDEPYELALGLMKETRHLFPENLIHFGRYKENMVCNDDKDSSEEIKKDRIDKTNTGVWEFFQSKIVDYILQQENQERSPVLWQMDDDDDNDNNNLLSIENDESLIPKQVILQINQLSTLQRAIENGYRVIASNSFGGLNQTWQSLYNNDFTVNITNSDQLARVLGGETNMEITQVVIDDDKKSIISQDWITRNAAAAERLWSPPCINGADLERDVEPRLERFQLLLMSRVN
ncbi:beta-N-acetylhexosaminidase [Cavenderia fasciculata]|uniref:Beta-hexosaminidase n=1 Tax=Cavenderia fasciculata TaxID=261658 RepID=F4PIF4_CACFS|nr:beta-N-acetylhexosaminidase [Cavenderia fasciculata]EGG25383.1 beta-N-acetylhexosaminidase [Cavenderia fasciculata]|eukprot:XP_004363234.1 beta-N-acetylhexosaminidase [Cavenderia fasciculata]